MHTHKTGILWSTLQVYLSIGFVMPLLSKSSLGKVYMQSNFLFPTYNCIYFALFKEIIKR